MNLAGTEFPLVNNRDMVKAMIESPFELVGSIPTDPKFYYRHEFTQYLSLEKELIYKGPMSTGIRKQPLPYGLTVYKGSKNMAVSRSFVDFIINSELSKQLKIWFLDTWAPDEHYIPTLVRTSVDFHNHVLQDHDLSKFRAKEGVIAPELVIRYTIFEEAAPDGWICGGRWQRWLCVFGFLNIPELYANHQNHMIANKFDISMDPIAIQCLEEKLVNATKKLTIRNQRSKDKNL
ncbi:beta-1,3-galactosyl-O-glycosyl-glycoprotein beta-1,6-N-acetylglucosaminyltransferase 4 [Eurytemora carolleeae]|uniref:beta-1,3-galactosyl-O-glycosyl-glycoprotein beta-1,6-N-acetylglucosaminyltransferase 4 n=1 Tax=Eurytemora carolleeae TaxID=1294199 RepID=UPI000C755D69|nr:beta-1,3-galactosyl-O-glycosyl-glycoprotein beta-1,6-N-acetylglucosaminyltransferase 4 [Eurytemora carolleeae]|eukprot:XP_023344012.1 beta-1,3-galactosyl-O-glycosyl-glycoprotein beta-1,6-N-acetylglucosaminyltransferase 4-like [Eurytemora affinis]